MVQGKTYLLWQALVVAGGILAVAFLLAVLFPGAAEVGRLFSPEEVVRSRAYQRGNYLFYWLGVVVPMLVLGWLLFSGRARAWGDAALTLVGWRYWPGVLLFSLGLWLLLRLLRLPLAWGSGYLWEHRFGLSHQTPAAWWRDYLVGGGLDLLFFLGAAVVFFWLLRYWPRFWWLGAGTGLALWLMLSSLLSPLLIDPLFYRFQPVSDPQVVQMVEVLTQRAGLQVDTVLVADASRRTSKVNAYFTGLGGTRRVVLYDNLLNAYPLPQVEGVLAHELGHWRGQHIWQGLLLGIAGVMLTLALTAYLLGGMSGPGRLLPTAHHPAALVVVMLLGMLVAFITTPLNNTVSRSFEREADQMALALTRYPEAEAEFHREIARQNVADLAPSPFITWFLFSHPPTIERIKNAQQWVEQGRGGSQ